jgi:2-polyprenyl-3-methyl-5-hydroxy-6-metoxy-1,4-benzoquinol methylase
MDRDRKKFLLAPAGGEGEGMGHLKRCVWLAEKLGASCSIYTGYLGVSARGYLKTIVNRTPAGHGLDVRDRLRAKDRWDMVVLDKRKTSAREYDGLRRHGRVLCLDEGGEARGVAAYLIDTLPGPRRRDPANIASLGFLNLPRRKRKTPVFPFRRILLSFGGGDSADLSGTLLEASIGARLFPRDAFTVVEGPFFKRKVWPEEVKVLRGVESLADDLPGYDLLFTHFGMAALEGMALGIPVILFNPSTYHRALGRLLGIPEIGVRKPDIPALRALIEDPAPLSDALDRFDAELKRQRGSTLAAHLRTLTPGSGGICPSCGCMDLRAVGRFPWRTYFRCKACGILFLDSFNRETGSYGKRYFSQEYRKQYGRTYLQDFDRIKLTGMQRIARMRKILKGGSSAMIVDAGCAFGPFLAALRDCGFRPFGVDVSAEAVKYVRDRMGIPAVHADFRSLERSSLPADEIRGVTFWYVLEHFQDLGRALRKAASLLPAGGVLAFSTPNSRGISAKKSLRSFLENSPADHFTMLSPREVPGMLARFGFKLKAVHVTGHHPERFPGFLGRAAEKSAPVRRALEAISRVLALGDTFEAYAVKENRR